MRLEASIARNIVKVPVAAAVSDKRVAAAVAGSAVIQGRPVEQSWTWTSMIRMVTRRWWSWSAAGGVGREAMETVG